MDESGCGGEATRLSVRMGPLRIGLDARMLLSAPPSAHAATIRQLLLTNASSRLPHEFVLYSDRPCRLPDDVKAPNVVLRPLPRSRLLTSDFWWLNTALAAGVRHDRIDVLFSCFYKIPLFTVTPCINMVHDTAFFNLPPSLLSGRHRSRFYRLLLYGAIAAHCAKAVRTVTVSEFSRRCLLRWFKLDPEKILVCYNAVDPMFYADGAPSRLPVELRLPPHYCLFIGSDIPKKNIRGTTEAFALLPEELRQEFPLVLRTAATASLVSHVEALGVSRDVRFLTDFLTHKQTVALVRCASLLVLLSYEEGFGLPVAEAIAARVPVLVSSGGSLPEVTGSKGVCLGVEGARGIAARWQSLLTDSEVRQQAIAEGARGAERFRRERIVPQLLEILTGACSGAD